MKVFVGRRDSTRETPTPVPLSDPREGAREDLSVSGHRDARSVGPPEPTSLLNCLQRLRISSSLAGPPVCRGAVPGRHVCPTSGSRVWRGRRTGIRSRRGVTRSQRKRHSTPTTVHGMSQRHTDSDSPPVLLEELLWVLPDRRYTHPSPDPLPRFHPYGSPCAGTPVGRPEPSPPSPCSPSRFKSHDGSRLPDPHTWGPSPVGP